MKYAGPKRGCRGFWDAAVAAYEAGRKSPSVETVLRLAKSIGLEATIQYHSPLTREDRRSIALHHAIARGLVADPERVLAQAQQNLTRLKVAAAGGSQLLEEWRVALRRPVAGRPKDVEFCRAIVKAGFVNGERLRERLAAVPDLDERVRSAAAARIPA